MPAPKTGRVRRQALAAIVGALWLAAVGMGVHTMLTYQSTTGAAAAPPARWPSDAPVELDRELPTLVLFAHPRCPCTRATVGELDRLMARVAGRLVVHALFYSDPSRGEGWERTDLWEHAERIPGVSVRADPLGRAAAAFGALTSGEVALYSPDGSLLFHGGITPARGHQGDNAGANAIRALIDGGAAATDASPVFGCSLCDPEAAPDAAQDAGGRP